MSSSIGFSSFVRFNIDLSNPDDAAAGEIAPEAYEQFLFDVEDIVDGGEEDPAKAAFEMERLRHAMHGGGD